MILMRKSTYACLAIALSIGATSLEAATITFDFSSGTNSSETAYGNVRTFTDAQTGITATLTSWSYFNFDDPAVAAHTTRYDADFGAGEKLALGVCNRGESGSLSACKANNATQADNIGQYEFFLIQFDVAVKPVNILVTPDVPFPKDPYDPILDVAYGSGLFGNTPVDPAALTIGAIPAAFGGLSTVSTPQGLGDKTVALSGGVSDTLFFGPEVTGYASDQDDGINPDRFGLLSLTVETPEPATLALMSLGLAGLGFARKRKQA